MGQRASLAVITDQGTELYYSHWRASTLDRDLFWGPAHATAFIRRQRSEAEGAEILDEVWAEGGAVVDETHRSLLWYGGEDVCFEIPRRRLHLALMRRLWRDWTVEWACEGIADIADALGISRDVVLNREPRDESIDLRRIFEPPEDPSWTSSILSWERNGELQFIATQPDLWEILPLGLQLPGSLADARGAAALDWTETTAEFPRGGVHVSWDRREISWWQADPAPGIESRVRAWFPGWRVIWWRDRCEAHAEAARGRLVFPVPGTESLLAALRVTLLAEDRDYSGTIPSVLTELGEEVEGINPFALRDDPPAISSDRRRRLLDAAVAQVVGGAGEGSVKVPR